MQRIASGTRGAEGLRGSREEDRGAGEGHDEPREIDQLEIVMSAHVVGRSHPRPRLLSVPKTASPVALPGGRKWWLRDAEYRVQSRRRVCRSKVGPSTSQFVPT